MQTTYKIYLPKLWINQISQRIYIFRIEISMRYKQVNVPLARQLEIFFSVAVICLMCSVTFETQYWCKLIAEKEMNELKVMREMMILKKEPSVIHSVWTCKIWYEFSRECWMVGSKYIQELWLVVRTIPGNMTELIQRYTHFHLKINETIHKFT